MAANKLNRKLTNAEKKEVRDKARRDLIKHNVLCGPDGPYEMRGDCQSMMDSTEPQVILSGVADSAKTWTCCVKIHLVCLNNPGAQCAIIRKTNASIAGSVLKTFGKIAADQGVEVVGGLTPNRFIYPAQPDPRRQGKFLSQSAIWVGGMDNPDRVLSTERDVIYVNQAEELSLNDWEYLSTRCTGRGAVVKHTQLIGDCNPGGSHHWIRTRAKEGTLRLLRATHKDNPTIYATDGKLTESGQRRLNALSNLSGIRRKRLFEGIWATAEGAVYEMFDAATHVLQRSRGEMKRFYLAMDEGFTNPAVILEIGEDSDGRWHCFREFFQTGQLQETVVAEATRFWKQHPEEIKDCCAVDESAAGLIADLVSIGVRARGGKGRVLDGINAVQNRLKVQGDGKPRYTVDPSCVNHINEFESYVWKPEKDVPVKENDHTLDALRYLEDVMAVPTGAFSSAKGIFTGSGEIEHPDAGHAMIGGVDILRPDDL